MDTGEGRFEQYPNMKELFEAKTRFEQLGKTVRGIFSVGEILEIRGSQFEVKEIWPQKLVLKLLPFDECRGLSDGGKTEEVQTIIEKIDALDRKLNRIFGGAVLINGKFVQVP